MLQEYTLTSKTAFEDFFIQLWSYEAQCQVIQYSWNMFILNGRGKLKRKTVTLYSAKENRFHPKKRMNNY